MIKGYTKEQLKIHYQEFVNENKKQPSAGEWKKWSHKNKSPSEKTIENYFGSWNNFIAECSGEPLTSGGYPIKERIWADKNSWLNYGKEKGYDKLGRSKLSGIDGVYYRKGKKNEWLRDLIQDGKTPLMIKTETKINMPLEEWLKNEYKSKNIGDIAKFLGQSKSCVHSWFKKLNIPRRDNSEAHLIDSISNQKILELFNKTKSISKVAEMCNLSEGCIYLRLKKEGIMFNSNSLRQILDEMMTDYIGGAK